MHEYESSNKEIKPYKVTLHYGTNGWKDPKDIEMTRVCYNNNGSISEIVYKATITVAKDDVIDFAYYVDRSVYNEPSKWYNNNGCQLACFSGHRKCCRLLLCEMPELDVRYLMDDKEKIESHEGLYFFYKSVI